MKNSILTILFSFLLTLGLAQTEVYYPEFNYDNSKDGTYENKSFSKEFLDKELPIIKPNLETLNPKKYPNFLNPNNREIVLFENHNLNSLKPVAKLNSLTQVYIDSIIYKYKFKDLTNCVWNRILIKEKYYYTDADIHDFSLTKKLNKLNQKVEIIGQNEGYDGAYHLGYPEHFFMIFTDIENKVINKTDVLKFYLNDEFAMEEDILKVDWNEKNKTYEINLIGADDKIKVIWNGKTFEIK
ncbi:hypothetical protein [Croceivirga sp. JEA036]|uniref:hypothetical protein n=1 Tax=Croceivirga sp. JEA036 TaxID=2721162 RepID=UPI001438A0E6|nr:hypothetical protein [Croceivirga sp. JEA036]NJB36624.1 hypothetical protein [Croceivirga sp. JEA036]